MGKKVGVWALVGREVLGGVCLVGEGDEVECV